MVADTVFLRFPHRTDESIVDTPDIILDKAADELMIRGQHTGRLIKAHEERKLAPASVLLAWLEDVSPSNTTDDMAWRVYRTLGPQVCALGALGLANGLTQEDLDLSKSPA